MENEFEIGVRVNESEAVQSLDKIDDKLEDIGTTAKKTNKTTQKGFAKTDKSVKTLNKDFTKLNKSIKSGTSLMKKFVGKATIAGIASLTAGIAGAGLAMNSLVQSSAQLKKISDNTGVAIDQLSKFATMTTLAGGEIDDMADAVQDFTEKFGEAKFDPKSSWAQGFKAMGVSLDQNVNSAIDETIKKLTEMTKAGKKSEAFFAGVDLFGDAYKRSFGVNIASGGANNKLINKFAIPQNVIDIFSDLGISTKKTAVMIKRYVAPYLASIGNVAINMLDKLDTIMMNGDPATVEEANKKLIEGLVGGILKVQEMLKKPFKTFMEFNKTLLLTLGMGFAQILTKLGGIIMALGPMAMLGASLQSFGNVISSSLNELTILNPFASKTSKLKAKENKRNVIVNDLDLRIKTAKNNKKVVADYLKKNPNDVESKKELKKYNDQILKYTKRKSELLSYDVSQQDDINNQIDKLKREVVSKEGQIGTAKTARQAKYNKKLRKEIKDLNLKITGLESAQSKDVSVLETATARLGDVVDVTLTVAGYGLAKKAESIGYKAISKKEAKILASTPKEENKLTKMANVQAQRKNITGGVGFGATTLKSIPLLKDFIGFTEQLQNLKLPTDFKGFTEDELRTWLEGIFKLPTPKPASTNEKSAPLSTKVDDSVATVQQAVERVPSFWEAVFGVEFTDGTMADKFNSMLQGFTTFADSVMGLINNISEYAITKDQERLNSWLDVQQSQLDSQTMSDRRRKEAQKKLDKEEEQRQKKIAKKKAKVAVANLWMNTLSSIPGIWGGYASAFAPMGYLAPALIASFGGATTAMVLASAGLQSGAIMAQANFANSGYVGSTGGADNRMINARDGELFLNGRDQNTLLDAIKGGSLGGTNVNIENFSGNDEDLSRLETMLYALQSNNRINDVMFA